MCYIISDEPPSLLQQKHVQGRLLHTVTTRLIAMCWGGMSLHSSKSIIGRDFDYSQPSLKLPCTSLLAIQEHYGLCIEPNATSGLSTFKGLNISDPHHFVSTFHPWGLLNASCYLSPFQLGRPLNPLPSFRILFQQSTQKDFRPPSIFCITTNPWSTPCNCEHQKSQQLHTIYGGFNICGPWFLIPTR